MWLLIMRYICFPKRFVVAPATVPMSKVVSPTRSSSLRCGPWPGYGNAEGGVSFRCVTTWTMERFPGKGSFNVVVFHPSV
jgi:hypothetical protein